MVIYQYDSLYHVLLLPQFCRVQRPKKQHQCRGSLAQRHMYAQDPRRNHMHCVAFALFRGAQSSEGTSFWVVVQLAAVTNQKSFRLV